MAKKRDTATRLVEEFGQAAAQEYWQNDQGYIQAEIDRAIREHTRAKKALLTYIHRLENRGVSSVNRLGTRWSVLSDR